MEYIISLEINSDQLANNNNFDIVNSVPITLSDKQFQEIIDFLETHKRKRLGIKIQFRMSYLNNYKKVISMGITNLINR